MRRRGKLCNEELYTLHPSKKVAGATKLRKLKGVDTCRAREGKTVYRIASENLNGRDHFGDLSVYGMILKRRLKKEDSRLFSDVIWLQDTVHVSALETSRMNLDNDQPDAHLIRFTLRPLQSSTCFEHYVLIIRRLNCIDAASGIVLSVSSRPVHRLRENCSAVLSQPVHRMATD